MNERMWLIMINDEPVDHHPEALEYAISSLRFAVDYAEPGDTVSLMQATDEMIEWAQGVGT